MGRVTDGHNECPFGGCDACQQQKRFSDAAVGHFGSGWAWLVKSGDTLKVVSTHDAGNPLKDGSGFPLLTAE